MISKKHKLNFAQLPECLKAIPDPPKQLFILGDLDSLLTKRRVGVVESRKVTAYGKTVTTQIATELTQAGVVVVSGLALGVDGLAHQAAVEQHAPTIAVLPCGLDYIYPRTHAQLANNILKHGGALVTEYPEGSAPYQANFLARNRLIAGLSEAIVVTEAAARSGSLNTANHCLAQGKPVFAVPGNITSPQSVGTNNLVKSGAIPVTSTNDILSELDIKGQNQVETLAANLEEATILQLLQDGISDGHELLTMSELDATIFNQTLTMLEITAKIKPLGNNHWSIS